MPYVFVEELQDGVKEADVVAKSDYETLQISFDSVAAERDTLKESLSDMQGQRDKLVGDLANAKQKFADSFLTSAQQIKKAQKEDVQKESRPAVTFANLFAERNPENAN